MKNKTALIVIGMLLGIGTLSACAGNSGVTPTEVTPQTNEMPTNGAPTDDLLTGGVSFMNDVLPILQANCTRCHGTSRASSNLKVNTYANLMAGGDGGVVVIAGDAAGSELVQFIETGQMPPQGSNLSEQEILTIRDWVDAGALDN